jgi:hypothetical protein
MRLWSGLALACAAVAGCGGAEEQQQPKGSRELTVTLPPTLPTEPATEEPTPQAGFETIATAEPAVQAPAPVTKPPAGKAARQRDEPPVQVEVAVAPAPETGAPAEGGAAPADAGAPEAAPDASPTVSAPAGTAAWAGYLRKAGFPCGRVAGTSRVERSAGPGLQFYKVDCEGGASYQATNKRGHLYFRRWRG